MFAPPRTGALPQHAGEPPKPFELRSRHRRSGRLPPGRGVWLILLYINLVGVKRYRGDEDAQRLFDLRYMVLPRTLRRCLGWRASILLFLDCGRRLSRTAVPLVLLRPRMFRWVQAFEDSGQLFIIQWLVQCNQIFKTKLPL